MNKTAIAQFINEVKFNHDGLVAVIAQDSISRDVLMMAWMNKESLTQTLEKKIMVYYSRSRQKLWTKGESSGHTQKLISLAVDCDGDTLLATVEQIGGIACHTGRANCFYRSFSELEGVIENSPVMIDPSHIYLNK